MTMKMTTNRRVDSDAETARHQTGPDGTATSARLRFSLLIEREEQLQKHAPHRLGISIVAPREHRGRERGADRVGM